MKGRRDREDLGIKDEDRYEFWERVSQADREKEENSDTTARFLYKKNSTIRHRTITKPTWLQVMADVFKTAGRCLV